MILKRSYFVDVSTLRWLKLRLQLTWLRLTGGYVRSLGLATNLPLAPAPIRLRRAVPQVVEATLTDELTRAARICPTLAITQTGKKFSIEDERCVRCGLCYLVAPSALAPSTLP